MKQTLLLSLSILISQCLIAQADTVSADKDTDYALPSLILSDEDLEGGEETQNISGLLQSSRDIFVSTAGYNFGQARYRIRGFDSEYTVVMINGVSVNDPESGRAYWSSWGGLNDALRDQDIKTGITESRLCFGDIGGFTNINTRASAYGKTVKVSYSLANRNYNNRLMFITSTGLTGNGWALTLSGSRRWAQEGYIEGTFYDAWSYFLSAEKKFNDKHSIGLVAYGAPNKRGRAGVATQEACDLSGTNYYNPYWGYQAGEKRNSRVANYHQPMVMFSHYWKPAQNSSLNSTLYYNFGKGGSSALNWVEAGDPRPDYYRNLPSYYQITGDEEMYEYYLDQWTSNQEFRQVNWDYFYFANSKYLYTVNNVDGIAGNDITGYRSKYIVEDRRDDKKQLGFNSTYDRKINENIRFSSGIDLLWYRGHHYNKIKDLLGGEFWLDIDKYANQEPFEITPESQSDLRHPNRLVKEGDIFGYDYIFNVDEYKVFAQGEFTYDRIEFYTGGELSYTTFRRTGNMQNGKFPDESYGDSGKNMFPNFGLKGGITYKINGRNYIVLNSTYLTRAPSVRTAYISSRTRDHVVEDLQSEKIFAGDLNYIIRSPFLKSRFTLYYAQFRDQTWARSFYHDDLNTFVNYVMTGVNKRNAGMELGLEANVSPTLTVSAVCGAGRFIYVSRPKVTIAQDNDSEILASSRTVYLKNYYEGGMPQTIASFGLKYSSPQYWFASLSVNYFDNFYLEIFPERRTEEALSHYYEGDVRIDETLNQPELPSAMTLDLFGGKSWKFGKYYVSLTASVSNLLNNKEIRIGGFEQFRFDPEFVNKFPPKYYYLYGRSYFVNLSVRI